MQQCYIEKGSKGQVLSDLLEGLVQRVEDNPIARSNQNVLINVNVLGRQRHRDYDVYNINPYPANTPKVSSLFHQHRARPACTSDQALYCWLTNFKFSS